MKRCALILTLLALASPTFAVWPPPIRLTDGPNENINPFFVDAKWGFPHTGLCFSCLAKKPHRRLGYLFPGDGNVRYPLVSAQDSYLPARLKPQTFCGRLLSAAQLCPGKLPWRQPKHPLFQLGGWRLGPSGLSHPGYLPGYRTKRLSPSLCGYCLGCMGEFS